MSTLANPGKRTDIPTSQAGWILTPDKSIRSLKHILPPKNLKIKKAVTRDLLFLCYRLHFDHLSQFYPASFKFFENLICLIPQTDARKKAGWNLDLIGVHMTTILPHGLTMDYSISSGLITRSQILKMPFFTRYFEFLPWGNCNRSKTTPKKFSWKNFNIPRC